MHPIPRYWFLSFGHSYGYFRAYYYDASEPSKKNSSSYGYSILILIPIAIPFASSLPVVLPLIRLFPCIFLGEFLCLFLWCIRALDIESCSCGHSSAYSCRASEPSKLIAIPKYVYDCGYCYAHSYHASNPYKLVSIHAKGESLFQKVI